MANSSCCERYESLLIGRESERCISRAIADFAEQDIKTPKVVPSKSLLLHFLTNVRLSGGREFEDLLRGFRAPNVSASHQPLIAILKASIEHNRSGEDWTRQISASGGESQYAAG